MVVKGPGGQGGGVYTASADSLTLDTRGVNGYTTLFFFSCTRLTVFKLITIFKLIFKVDRSHSIVGLFVFQHGGCTSRMTAKITFV